MKTVLAVLCLSTFSFGAFAQAQANNEVRVAGDLQGGVNYVGVRRTYEVVSVEEVLGFAVGGEMGILLNKANLGPSFTARFLPNDLIGFYAGVQQDLLHGETNMNYGAEVKISNSARVSLGKVGNESGSTTYVGLRLKPGQKRGQSSRM